MRRIAAILLLAALVLAAAGLSSCSPSAADVAAQHKQQCFMNQKQIKMAIDLVNADSGVYPDITSVVTKMQIKCPDGGVYSFDPATNTVSCSVHGVAPATPEQ